MRCNVERGSDSYDEWRRSRSGVPIRRETATNRRRSKDVVLEEGKTDTDVAGDL